MNKENLIKIPSHSPIKRFPGNYTDIPKYDKKRNNYMILHSCKMLNKFYNKDGITALVLDGKEMRTTNVLMKLGEKLKKIDIVEINPDTYNRMKQLTRNNKKINAHNMHLKNYLDFNLCDPLTNLVYFDAMCSLFSSEASFGSDIMINEFLRRNKCNQIIFGITICLRDGYSMNYKVKEKKILTLLDKIFSGNGFEYTNLTSENDSRYKGQNMYSRAMTFYLFFLERI